MTVTTLRPTCHGIVPPHIHIALAERGDRRQRERALRHLQVDTSLRAARIGRSSQLLAFRQGQRFQRPRWVAEWRKWQGAPEDAARTIYDAEHRQRLPGSVVRHEENPPGADIAVDEAYEYMGDTFQFYWDAYGRNSIDDAGLPLVGTVHYDQEYDNAFWNGEQMVYGDGDEDVFNRFTIAVDIIGHELTHGVTEAEAGLIYWGQAGALNESISDVFGSLVKQAVNQETADEADWLIGEGLLTKKVNGVALRSMSEPGTAYDDPVLGKDPQPAHMDGYVHTIDDNGGVHINSGIPNRAFYLVATYLGGYAWEDAGRIWYETLRSPQLRPSAQFAAFAQLTTYTAQELYGANSAEADAVGEAWSTVGVRVESMGIEQRGSRLMAFAGPDQPRGYSSTGDFTGHRVPRVRRGVQGAKRRPSGNESGTAEPPRRNGGRFGEEE